MNSRRDLPVGIKEEECYLFYEEGTPDGFLSRADQRRLLEEGASLASFDRGRRSPAAASSSDPPPGQPRFRLGGKQASEDRRRLPPEPDEWESAESTLSVLVGTAVPPPSSERCIGDRGLSQLSDGSFVFARRRGSQLAASPPFGLPDPRDAVGDREETAARGDARTLAIRSGALGRHRDFASLADDCSVEEFPDFPLAGPRTAMWCLRFLKKRRSPVDHHAFFRAVTRLGGDAWGMAEHESLCQALEMAGQYDQLDLSSCAFAEALLRRVQTIEWVYYEKVREVEGQSNDRLTAEELAAFAGASRGGEILMIAPELLAHVRSQVETDVGIMKAMRKAREERELRRTRKKKGGGREADGA